MRNHTTASLTNALIVLGVMMGVLFVLPAVAMGGLMVFACVMSLGTPTTGENRSLDVTELAYDDTTGTVVGRLVGQRNSNVNQPVTVTITAAVTGEPEVRAEAAAREQMYGVGCRVMFELTAEQAKAFADPQARRTVTIRGQDGRLILAERPWPTPAPRP